MKTEFTFAEVAKIFAQVEKVENAANWAAETSDKFTCIDAKFDGEFEKYNYTFFGAPDSLHDLFEQKTSAMDAMKKAERKAFKAIKDFAEIIGINENPGDYAEVKINYFLHNRCYWEIADMVYAVKSLAMDATRKIDINAYY